MRGVNERVPSATAIASFRPPAPSRRRITKQHVIVTRVPLFLHSEGGVGISAYLKKSEESRQHSSHNTHTKHKTTPTRQGTRHRLCRETESGWVTRDYGPSNPLRIGFPAQAKISMDDQPRHEEQNHLSWPLFLLLLSSALPFRVTAAATNSTSQACAVAPLPPFTHSKIKRFTTCSVYFSFHDDFHDSSRTHSRPSHTHVHVHIKSGLLPDPAVPSLLDGTSPWKRTPSLPPFLRRLLNGVPSMQHIMPESGTTRQQPAEEEFED